jgi:hypothetical protein
MGCLYARRNALNERRVEDVTEVDAGDLVMINWTMLLLFSETRALPFSFMMSRLVA